MDAARLSKIVTPKREKVIKDCFLEWDKGKKGFLNKHETNCAFLELFGCKLIQVCTGPGLYDENQSFKDSATSWLLKCEHTTDRRSMYSSSSSFSSLSFSETLSQTLQSELEKLFEDGKEEGVEDESNEVVVGLAFAKFDQAVREKFYLQDRDEEIRNAFKAFDTQGKISGVL